MRKTKPRCGSTPERAFLRTGVFDKAFPDSFTAQNVNLIMKRKDEIWFTEKDDKGLSTLYSLADFTDLGDGDFESDYLFGEFGAIPTLSSIMKEEE